VGKHEGIPSNHGDNVHAIAKALLLFVLGKGHEVKGAAILVLLGGHRRSWEAMGEGQLTWREEVSVSATILVGGQRHHCCGSCDWWEPCPATPVCLGLRHICDQAPVTSNVRTCVKEVLDVALKVHHLVWGKTI
jgi:hypothetical protein